MSNGTYAPTQSHVPWVMTTQSQVFDGPERRRDLLPIVMWLAATLDEIDYGLLLLHDGTTVAHANQLARTELQGDHPLQLAGNSLRTRHAKDAARLREAITAATSRGTRLMLTLGLAPKQVTVAVVPVRPRGRMTGAQCYWCSRNVRFVDSCRCRVLHAAMG